MSFTAQDVVPISEARARLTELADDVVAGAEKLLTKNGAAYVALVDARKLDFYHRLEEEHASLVRWSRSFGQSPGWNKLRPVPGFWF